MARKKLIRGFGNIHGMKIAGLRRGKEYWVRVRAVGPDGPGGWSDPSLFYTCFRLSHGARAGKGEAMGPPYPSSLL
jgi:hypothetical protein